MQGNYTTFKPNLEGVKYFFSEIVNNSYHIHCERFDKRTSCCGRKMNIKDYRYVKIKDFSYANKEVIINVKKQRYVCPVCKKIVTSELDFVDKRCTISKGIKGEIRRKFREVKSLKQIALEEKVSVSTVFRELDNFELEKKKDLDTSVIYLDEFKGNAGKSKFQLAIYDKNRSLITILEDRNSSTIKNFLRELDTKPSVVVIDMFNPFRSAITSIIPDVEIVVDKFHVVRQANWMIRDVRIRLFNSDSKKYRDYKKYWKLIAKNPLKIFTEKEESRINEFKNKNEDFSKAYELRRKFYELFEQDNVEKFRIKLTELIEKLKESEIRECAYFGETLLNWKKEIENIVKYGINNGFVEGYNNKIKVIKRVSYGIRKYERLRKLIQLRTA